MSPSTTALTAASARRNASIAAKIGSAGSAAAIAGESPAMLPAAAALPAMAPRIDLLECLADVFVRGVLCTLSAARMVRFLACGLGPARELRPSRRAVTMVSENHEKANRDSTKKARAAGHRQGRAGSRPYAPADARRAGRMDCSTEATEIGLKAKK